MNTNSYLMLVAIVIGIFILWVLTMTWNLLKYHVVPLSPYNIDSKRVHDSVKSPILKRESSGKRKPIIQSDRKLWEKEQNAQRGSDNNIL